MDISKKKLVIFDMDDTLAESKVPLDAEMGALLSRLIELKKVAVISGGGYPQFETQLLQSLPMDANNFTNLYLLPTSGTKLYSWKGTWSSEYDEHLTPVEKERILTALNESLKMAGFAYPPKSYGALIEDRGSQITFSALGQQAPVSEKKLWDPDRSKRNKIADILRPKLLQFDVRVGGSTSIDITRKGINKSYGIRKLEQFLNMPIDDMVFVGDALFPGGNDYPAKASGVDCIAVKNPSETKELIKSWLPS